ncbi:MAG: rRNA maturation RNase YbeY [Bacteroidota bacterium]
MEINYNYETDFSLSSEERYSDWINRVLLSEDFEIGELGYIFCDDNYLLRINQKFLGHETLTDIITFDYSESSTLSGDIFISVERVRSNAETYEVSFEEELKRVMVHGVLHLMGYKDKQQTEVRKMRDKEDEKIKMFHVEH